MRSFEHNLRSTSAAVEDEHLAFVGEEERKKHDQREAARTDGTDPEELLGYDTQYALDFVRTMAEHDMPGSTSFKVEAGAGNTEQEVKGYAIGVIGVQHKPPTPFNPRPIDSSKFDIESDLSEEALIVVRPENYLDHDTKTRLELRPVFLCSDGKLRTNEGKNIIKDPEEEFIPGVEFKTRHKPGHFRTYSDEQDRFYHIPLERLLPALADSKLNSANSEYQAKTKEYDAKKESRLKRIAQHIGSIAVSGAEYLGIAKDVALDALDDAFLYATEKVREGKEKTEKVAKRAGKDLQAFAKGDGKLDIPKIDDLDLREEEAKTEEISPYQTAEQHGEESEQETKILSNASPRMKEIEETLSQMPPERQEVFLQENLEHAERERERREKEEKELRRKLGKDDDGDE